MLKHCIAPAVAGLLVLAPGSVLAQAPTGEPPVQQEPRAEQPRTEEPRAEEPRAELHDPEMVIRADRLIGQQVRGRDDERLGRIDDLALNVNDNEIAYAVIARGGLFGIGAEHVALPWDQIQPDPVQRVVRLDQAALEQATRIDTRAAWPTDIGRPEAPAAEQPVGTTGREEPVGTVGRDPQQIVSVSRVIGMDVQNPQGERLGQIDDVVIQRDGSVSYAVIAHGGFLGIGHNYVAVPWDRMQIDPQREQLTLNVTQQQLEAAREFEHRERWPARVDWPFGN